MIAVYLENGKIEVRKRPRPARPEGFAVIRLLAGGICNTDLELQRGYYGFRGTPGHEFAGEVVDSDAAHLRGKRVVGEINLACTKCEWCKRRLGRHCPNRKVLGIVKHPGAFREFLTLPERNLHIIPPGISSEHAVFVEPLAAACEILDQVRIPRGSHVAVLGDGKLGLLIAQVLQNHGVRVHQFGHHKEKLAIAEKVGVTGEIARDGVLPVSAYDWVVEATGSAEGLRQAAAMARPRGAVVMKSTVHSNIAIDTAPVIVNEITLIGSRCGRFEPALKLLRGRNINLDPMLSGSFSLDRAADAFARASKRGVLKVLLTGT